MRWLENIRKVHGLWILVVAVCMTMFELMFVRVAQKCVLGMPAWMREFLNTSSGWNLRIWRGDLILCLVVLYALGILILVKGKE